MLLLPVPDISSSQSYLSSCDAQSIFNESALGAVAFLALLRPSVACPGLELSGGWGGWSVEPPVHAYRL